MINRREFIGAAAAASAASLLAQQIGEWGGPVLDIHLHLRADDEANLAHINGSGVTQGCSAHTRAVGGAVEGAG